MGSNPPRTLSYLQKVLKKIGITKYETFKHGPSYYWNMNHLRDSIAKRKSLIDFKQEVISGWKMISDKEILGRSSATFAIENGIGILEGNLETELTEEQKALGYVHTGFIAEFYPPENMDHMDAFLLKIKTDKRLYLCQIKTLSPWEEDLYQAIIPVPKDEEVDQWREVILPYSDFYLTFKGYVEEPKVPLDGRNIKHVGFMMAERKSGPFKLEIASIEGCKKNSFSKRYTGL